MRQEEGSKGRGVVEVRRLDLAEERKHGGVVTANKAAVPIRKSPKFLHSYPVATVVSVLDASTEIKSDKFTNWPSNFSPFTYTTTTSLSLKMIISSRRGQTDRAASELQYIFQ